MKTFFKNSTWIIVVILLFLQIPAFANKPISTENNPKTPKTDILNLPKVDTRTELSAIVFRLAGNPEYNQNNFKEYVADIEQFFAPFRNHEAVQFAKNMFDNHGVGYDAVAAISFYMEPLPSLKPIMTYTDEEFERWGGASNALKYTELLRKFADDSHCAEFFRKHEQLYALAEQRFKSVYDELDVDWFTRFYGTKPSGKLFIVVGLGNGGCNYGTKVIHADKREDCYAVMGTWAFDSLGKPSYSASGYLPTMIHEFNHSFVNDLNEKHFDDFKASASKIFEYVKFPMQRQAYPMPLYMLNEALVRTCVIQYEKSHNTDGGKSIIEEIACQKGNAFVWIDRLANALDKYEANRTKYTTLESFIPALADFYNGLAQDADAIFDQCPKIATIEPFANNSTTVDATTKQMKIRFDKPLVGKGCSIWKSQSEGTMFPIDGKNFHYEDNNQTLVLGLALQPGTQYEFVLVGSAFKTPDGLPLIDCVVSFKTK